MPSADEPDPRLQLVWQQTASTAAVAWQHRSPAPATDATAAEFFHHDPACGTLHNGHGQRVVRMPADFLDALLSSLEGDLGSEVAHQLMYRCGYEWGVEDMLSFAPRAQAEYEQELSQLGMGVLMEAWWWPLSISGWGTWQYDFRYARQGLIFVDLYESVIANSTGELGKVVCYFYAGLFSAFFSVLAKRPLECLEIACTAAGDANCKFLVSTPARLQTVSGWQTEGLRCAEIMTRLTTAGAA